MDKDIEEALEEVLKKPVIGFACWICKWRTSDSWEVRENFCKYYPTYFERQYLFGRECIFFEVDDEYLQKRSKLREEG